MLDRCLTCLDIFRSEEFEILRSAHVTSGRSVSFGCVAAAAAFFAIASGYIVEFVECDFDDFTFFFFFPRNYSFSF